MKEETTERATCHDCDVLEGGIHELGCDMEKCPFCGTQLITCHCVYKMLDIDCSPGTWAYENGLTDQQEEIWLRLLEASGRIPYIRWPNICRHCGMLWPKMFHVPDEEWNRYIEPRMRSMMVCRPCYDLIKSWVDESTEESDEH